MSGHKRKLSLANSKTVGGSTCEDSKDEEIEAVPVELDKHDSSKSQAVFGSGTKPEKTERVTFGDCEED